LLHIFISVRDPVNANQLKGDWRLIKGKAAVRWGKLTDNDLAVIAGKRDQLLGVLQRLYGKAQEQIEREVNEFDGEALRAE
jgi:uncharacterized protein YjbJ (UPF0337 family)